LIPAAAIGAGLGAIGAIGGATAAQAAWDFTYQSSPIYLEGGTFAGLHVPFPMAGLAGSVLSIAQGLASGPGSPFLGKFMVIPGGKLLSQAAATYPFASQQIAANATVQQPIAVSLLLRAPVKDGFGYATKAAIFTSLKQALTLHNNAGGTYIVFTPAFMYDNCLLLDVTDVTDGESKQEQVMWQFDFYQPLITRAQANAATNPAMTRMIGGQPPTVAGPPTWGTLGGLGTAIAASAGIG
jgi:hypothetical protein